MALVNSTGSSVQYIDSSTSVPSVRADALQSNTNIFLIEEQTSLITTTSLTIDVGFETGRVVDRNTPPDNQDRFTIAPGTSIRTVLLHIDPASGSINLSGLLAFDRPILGFDYLPIDSTKNGIQVGRSNTLYRTNDRGTPEFVGNDSDVRDSIEFVNPFILDYDFNSQHRSGAGNPVSDQIRIYFLDNQIPIARNDSFSTLANQSIIINPLSNDSDPDNDFIDYSPNFLPSTTSRGGQLQELGSGLLRYTPPPGYTGTDTFEYRITDPNGTNLNSNRATVSITVTSPPPPPNVDISISDAQVTEGGVLQFPVSLSRSVNTSTVLSYTTLDGTATANDNDYVSTTSTLVIPAGQTSGFIAVSTLDDDRVELTESMQVRLTSASASGIDTRIIDSFAVGSIMNDDTAAITIEDVIFQEGDISNITVTLSHPVDTSVDVPYALSPGTATADDDYFAINGTLTFSPGQTVGEIEVQTITDTLVEADETVRVLLENPITQGRNVQLKDSEGIITIQNDDDAIVVVETISLVEGDGENTQAELLISLSNPVDVPVHLSYTTVEGSATSGEDYSPANGTVVLVPGQLTETILIDLIADDLDEQDENFKVSLALDSERSVRLNNDEVVIAIQDDDYTPIIESQSFLTQEDKLLISTISATDIDTPLEGLTFSLPDGTSRASTNRGVVQVNEDGSFVYTPNQDEFGADEFSVIASDGTNVSEAVLLPIVIETSPNRTTDYIIFKQNLGSSLFEVILKDGNPVFFKDNREITTQTVNGFLAEAVAQLGGSITRNGAINISTLEHFGTQQNPFSRLANENIIIGGSGVGGSFRATFDSATDAQELKLFADNLLGRDPGETRTFGFSGGTNGGANSINIFANDEIIGLNAAINNGFATPDSFRFTWSGADTAGRPSVNDQDTFFEEMGALWGGTQIRDGQVTGFGSQNQARLTGENFTQVDFGSQGIGGKEVWAFDTQDEAQNFLNFFNSVVDSFGAL